MRDDHCDWGSSGLKEIAQDKNKAINLIKS